MPAGAADLYAGFGSQSLYGFTSSAVEVQLDQAGGAITVVEVRGANNEKAQLNVDGSNLVAVVLNAASAGTKARRSRTTATSTSGCGCARMPANDVPRVIVYRSHSRLKPNPHTWPTRYSPLE